MPTITIDGIATRYETLGSGPPLLMFSPGGFDAALEKWASLGIYGRNKPLDALAQKYTCIVFDRRECGQSGGRIERVTWAQYIAQGKGLLDHLGIKRAHLMGGCMGCCPVMAFGVANPEMVASMVLVWPVGGAKWRIRGHQRFADHLAFAQEHGLAEVAAHVAQESKSFNADPRGGPWASVLKHDRGFADDFVKFDADAYRYVCLGMMQSLFDRDTAPGADAEDLLRCRVPAFIVPGQDDHHATSAARYLQECLPKAEYWDAPVDEQTAEPMNKRLVDFLDRMNERL